MYDTDIIRETISKSTNTLVEDMIAGQNRPLDPLYAVLLSDAIMTRASGAPTVSLGLSPNGGGWWFYRWSGELAAPRRSNSYERASRAVRSCASTFSSDERKVRAQASRRSSSSNSGV